MTEQDMIDRLMNNERAFYFLSKEEQSFMRNWPHGVSILDPRSEDDLFYTVSDPAFFGGGVYRLNPAPHTPLNLPWEWIDDRYQWAAMNGDGRIHVHVREPRMLANYWLKTGSGFHIDLILKIDTTGINWRTSLTKRPEAGE